MIGRRLKHYEVEEKLGQGGMGVVYRARDVRLDRPVALKVLRAEVTSDADRKRRFLQEARAASAVNHPAIAQVYDVDEADGTTFIAMEFVEGRTVRQLVSARELDLLASVEIAIQVVEGLGRAHEARLVHRDVKSDNIMVTRDGHAKILDFGLAKLLPQGLGGDGGQDPSQVETAVATRVGTVLGTVAYMSPEQARGRLVDQRSDLFSAGIVIYEMVTGELPFRGDSPLDTMHAIAFDEVRPVTVVRQGLPPELQRILTRCLRKRPEDRYPDAAALAGDLKRLKQDIESGVQRSVPPAERLNEARRWLETSMPFGVTGAVVAVAVVALLVFLLVSDVGLGTLVLMAFIALYLYRFVRNRRGRMIEMFVAKVSDYPEVKAVRVRGNHITVFLDKAQAGVYVRINGLLETVNQKLFYGDPIEVALRDDEAGDSFQSMLREPGVAYVRDDAIR
jgi:serine/threonine protein kinase